MAKHDAAAARPDAAAIEGEINRVKNNRRFHHILRDTLTVLVAVAAIAVLVATFLLPVMRVYGNAMTPNIAEGEIVVAIKTKEPQRGDIIAFYYNNRILLRRVIAMPGEVVSIDDFGVVRVSERLIASDYIIEPGLGVCDIEMPYRVPDGSWFVMGDNRMTAIDSRSSAVGCVTQEQLAGKVLFCIWPFDSIRWIGSLDIT